MGRKQTTREVLTSDMRLTAKKVKDTPRKVTKQFTKGRKTKLGIYVYIAQIFAHNERCQRSVRCTNAAIEDMLKREFKHVKTFIKNLEARKYSANYYRTYFNNGKLLTHGSVPSRISLRYNNDKLPVDNWTGKRLLSCTDIKAKCDKYGIKDDRISTKGFKLDPDTTIPWILPE